MSKNDLQNALTERLREKRSYVRKVEEVETEIIGLRLQLDKISESERLATQQEYDRQRCLGAFDEDL